MRIDRFSILLIFIIILFVFITQWHFKNFQKSASQIKLPEIKIQQPPMPGADTKKEFKDEKENFKFTFPGDWIEMPKERLEDSYLPKKDAKFLFLVQKVKLPKFSFASLAVQEYQNIKTKEELIKEIQEKLKEVGEKMEILQETEDYFEAKYYRKALTLISREKIIFGKDNTFLISFFVPEQHIGDFEEEIKEILNSVQVLK